MSNAKGFADDRKEIERLTLALTDATALAEEQKAALVERDRSLEDAASTASQVGPVCMRPSVRPSVHSPVRPCVCASACPRVHPCMRVPQVQMLQKEAEMQRAALEEAKAKEANAVAMEASTVLQV